MKEKVERLKLRVVERLEDAKQDAYYAHAPDENQYHRTRAEELEWCLTELTAILSEEKEK